MGKTEQWNDLWKDLVEIISKGDPGFELYSPRILIEDILNEIDFNQFKNNDNKKFFYDKLSEYLGNDIALQEMCGSLLKLLRKDFNSAKLSYLTQIARQISEVFSKGDYFQRNLDLTKQLLLSDEPFLTSDDYEKLRYCAVNLIVEFLSRGYVAKDIERFMEKIFDDYSFPFTNVLITDFPHGVLRSDFETVEQYNHQVTSLVDSLNLEDRLDKLLYFYDKKRRQVNYIFAIEGLIADELTEIGEVTFYTLDQKRYLAGDPREEEIAKDFLQPVTHVAVKVDMLMVDSSFPEAVQKAENALNLISLFYPTRTELKLIFIQWLVVNEAGECISSSRGRKNDGFIQRMHAIKTSELKKNLFYFDRFARHVPGSETEQLFYNRLMDSMHWYRKAEHSKRYEDKILNYWIALENLFFTEYDISDDILNGNRKSKIHLIQECVSDGYANISVHTAAWDLYFYFENYVRNFKYLAPDQPVYHLSDEIIERGQLDGRNKKVHIRNFIGILTDLMGMVGEEILIKDRIAHVRKLYADPSALSRHLSGQIEVIKTNVLLVYRFRNLIVHNAHFEHMLLPYYTEKIREYSGFMIRMMLSKADKPRRGLADAFLAMHLKKERIVQDLSEGKIYLLDNYYD